MLKRIELNQVRLLSRPCYPEFEENIIQDWESTDADFAVICHGQGDLPPLPPDTKIKDWRAVTDGSLTSSHRRLFTDILTSLTYDIVGIMDDDALYEYPRTTISKILEVFDTFKSPSGRPVGAAGPMSAFFHFTKHDNLWGAIAELEKNPWAFYGSQFYHRKALMAIDYQTLCDNLKYWSDFAIMMEIHRQGFCLVEAHIPGYKHRGSKGKSDDAEIWTAEQALAQVEKEGKFLDRWFANTMYLDFIHRLHHTIKTKKLLPRIKDPNYRYRHHVKGH